MIYVHTLCFNTPTEVVDAVEDLHRNNDCKFNHVVVDLGFPLRDGDKCPKDLDKSAEENSVVLQSLARKNNSHYVRTKNVGVSQNWEFVRDLFSVGDGDCLICCDPDERPQNIGWVGAIGDVLKDDSLCWVSLMMPEHEAILSNYRHELKTINGHRVYVMGDLINWAQGGFSGRFLREIGGVQVPNGASIYGWLEHAHYDKMLARGKTYGILADYYVEHTEASPVYREWKNAITSGKYAKNQIDFVEWLRKEKC